MGVGTRRLVFLAASPLVTAPPSNLTRLYYNGSAVKSHSTILQRLRRQISLDYYTIPPATQATIFLAATAPFAKSHASYFRFARFNTSTLYYLRAWHRLTMKEVMVHIYRKIKQISVPFFRSCCVDALKKSLC